MLTTRWNEFGLATCALRSGLKGMETVPGRAFLGALPSACALRSRLKGIETLYSLLCLRVLV